MTEIENPGERLTEAIEEGRRRAAVDVQPMLEDWVELGDEHIQIRVWVNGDEVQPVYTIEEPIESEPGNGEVLFNTRSGEIRAAEPIKSLRWQWREPDDG